MSAEFPSNYFASPTTVEYEKPAEREKAPGRLLAPAMALIAVAVVGLGFSLYNFALSFGEAQVDPNSPPFVQDMQRGAVGPVATAIQGAFAMLNVFIILSGVQMMSLKSWGMSVAGSVLAMVNIGSCCCAAGIPVGLWCLAVLMSPEIITIFTAAKAEQYQS
jgi:hypothetical protein